MKPKTVIVIFGITGNLAKLKVIPALYDLFNNQTLDSQTEIIGIGRKKYKPEEFAIYVLTMISEYAEKQKIALNPKFLNLFLSNLKYIDGDTTKNGIFKKISRHLKKNSSSNLIFYLATYPSLYKTIFTNLQKEGMTKIKNGWVKILIEKPLGVDLSSARELNQTMSQFFDEKQIFRLDHYLGKETLQNILAVRFGNSIFEPLFNAQFVDHIQITMAEDFGIGERGEYFDCAGEIRDTGQNHMLQMLTLMTMDSPSKMTSEEIAKERIKILSSLEPNLKEIIFGQYEGYRKEKNVNSGSLTDTFFALKTKLNDSKFKDVPIYLRAGKMLKMTATEIAIVFKKTNNSLFNRFENQSPNALIFRVSPNEGVVLKFLAKKPGSNKQLESSTMEFCYRSFTSSLPNPYVTLIADAILGNQTFFNDAREVEAQWKFVDQLINLNKKPIIYPAFSWGPKEATDLIEKDGRRWIDPSEAFCKI
jgi:glucose-6-phosphate 1-dehydrogenase